MTLEEYAKENGLDLGDYSWAQMQQIRIGLEKGLDISIYANSEYNWFQMRQLRWGLEEGLDVSLYANSEYNDEQMRQIRWGLEKSLDISAYANLKYDWNQMEQIRWGLEDGLDVSIYTNPEYDADQMEQIRKGLEEGLDVSFYANPEYDWLEMEEIRMDLENKIENDEKKRLFVDMDGTLAVWGEIPYPERLLEQGYFLNRPPVLNVVNAVREIIKNNPDIEVFVLSSCMKDSLYAEEEKNLWLDKYLPEIDKDHRLFPAFGQDKATAIQGGIRENDYLLDDYSENLFLFDPPGNGIKILNGINHTKGSWNKNALSYEKTSGDLAKDIVHIINDKEKEICIQDEIPEKEYVYSEAQQQVLDKAMKLGVNTSVMRDPAFSSNQMEEIQLGLKQGVDVSIYAIKESYVNQNGDTCVKPVYTWEQMEQLRLVQEHRLVDISKYQNPDLSPEEMIQMQLEDIADLLKIPYSEIIQNYDDVIEAFYSTDMDIIKDLLQDDGVPLATIKEVADRLFEELECDLER